MIWTFVQGWLPGTIHLALFVSSSRLQRAVVARQIFHHLSTGGEVETSLNLALLTFPQRWHLSTSTKKWYFSLWARTLMKRTPQMSHLSEFSQLAHPLIAMLLKLLLVYSHYLCFSPFFALGHIVRLSHMKVTHLFSWISPGALGTREAFFKRFKLLAPQVL